jgi:hypothetical protein
MMKRAARRHRFDTRGDASALLSSFATLKLQAFNVFAILKRNSEWKHSPVSIAGCDFLRDERLNRRRRTEEIEVIRCAAPLR